jgi:hypothetical protein
VRWMTGASKEPPPPTTLAPSRERGCPLQPQNHGRSCRTSSTLQHHSPGGGSGDCARQLHCRLAHTGGFLAGATRYTTRRRRSVPPWGTHGLGGVRFPYFFPWMAGHLCLNLSARRRSERDDPGPPVVPGGLWIGLGSRTLEERVGHWGGPATVRSLLCVGGPATVRSLLCVAETRATWPNGEWGSSIVLAANAGPRVPSGGVTLKRRCTYRP